ncbi:MAG TPA: hypothetical protein VK421_07435 [Pyrinomonadaceae bacterium]|nr:hypothetical protein [Pyrinomonadaceae bacterium]
MHGECPKQAAANLRQHDEAESLRAGCEINALPTRDFIEASGH